MGDYFDGSPPALRVVVGLGANLGDRRAALRGAARALASLDGVRWVASSQVYETPPAGGPPQPDYLNAAVLLSIDLAPRALLIEGLAIERAMGRRRPDPVRWGPRPIDIDLLWADGRALDEPGLTLPHPRLAQRVFALRPLLDLCPDARDPAGNRYADDPMARATIRCLGPLSAPTA